MIKKRWYELLWLLLAITVLITVFITKSVDFPLFTLIWLVVSILIFLNQGIEILTIKKKKLASTLIATGIFLLVSWGFIAIVEYLTGTYGELINLVKSTESKDITFYWIKVSQTPINYLILFLFGFFVTIFAEESFFRGYLLKALEEKYSKNLANILQAILFTLPQIIAGFMFPALQGVIYILGYSFILYGLMSGFMAQKTGNIWPGLITASVNNLILTLIYFT